MSVQVVVGRKVFKQQAGSEGRCCGVGEESRPPGHQSRTGSCLEWARAGAGSGVGKHADEAGSFNAPPTAYFDAPDDFDFDFTPACPKAALFGAQAMWDQNVSEWSKTLQNHHSTASTTPDPGQGYTTGPTVEIAWMPQAC